MRTYWWFRPSRIVLLVVLPISLFAYGASNKFFGQFSAINVISDYDYFLIWLSIMGFAGASWFGEVLRPARSSGSMPQLREANYRILLVVLAFVAVGATLIMLAPFATRPDLVLSAVRGDPDAAFVVRLYANQISGVTSQSNLLSLVIVLIMAKPKLTGYSRSRPENLLLTAILVICAFKVVLHTERLALIELAIPLCILLAATRRRSALWSAAPVLGVVAMLLFFTGTEYLRSWVTFYAGRSDSLIDFALTRILGYYATSLNNGAFIYNEGHSYFFPIFTGEWLWHMPIGDITDFLTRVVGARINFADLQDLQYAEFNNTSGLFAPLVDFGPVLGILTWTALGYFSGCLFRRFADGHALGLILFPTWYIGLLEMPRIFYWGDNRYFPPLVVSLGISFMLVHLLPQPRRTLGVQHRSIRNVACRLGPEAPSKVP